MLDNVAARNVTRNRAGDPHFPQVSQQGCLTDMSEMAVMHAQSCGARKEGTAIREDVAGVRAVVPLDTRAKRCRRAMKGTSIVNVWGDAASMQ